MSLKEKFQITLPNPNPEQDGDWASFESARDTKEEHPYNNRQSADKPDGKFNEMPPGMENSNQFADIHDMPFALANGQSDVTKPDKDLLKKGYTRAKLTGTDDQYTGEHIDLFYGIAYGDTKDEVGFIERNNYLDRE
jgi:hypothetical protein